MGQSVVELALILPVMLTLVGAVVDVARLYGAWVTLEAATRDAAEQVATTDGAGATLSSATAHAQAIVCSETASLPGFVAPAGNPTNCSSPTVSLTWSTSSTAPGASTKNPIGTATVQATLPFRTFFAYPLFTQGGVWTLSSTQTYTIIQGRT